MPRTFPKKAVWQVEEQEFGNPVILLPPSIQQLRALAELIELGRAFHEQDLRLSSEACHGLATILYGILEDLEAIDTTLQAVDVAYFQPPAPRLCPMPAGSANEKEDA